MINREARPSSPAANGVALALAFFIFALAVWIVVPAPVLPLLLFAVVVPEKAADIAVAAAVILVLALAIARGRPRRIAAGLACAALACASIPLLEYPFAHAAAARELAREFGPEPAAPDPAETTGLAGRDIVTVTDLPVTTRDGERLGLDVYALPGAGLRPTIVTVYGGAWIFGSRKQMAQIDRYYAARGYTAIAIDYRHAPAFRFPVQLHDVEDALATIAAHAAAWHVDRGRVAMFGRSAGAELALLAAYAPEPLRIRAVVGYYVPTDLRRGYEHPPWPDPANVRRILTTYIGAAPDRAPDAYRAASPIAAVRPGLPPTFLIGGGRDALVALSYQREMRDALRVAGDRVVAIELPWSNHAFDTVEDGLGASIATPAAERFLGATLGPGGPCLLSARSPESCSPRPDRSARSSASR